MNYDQKANSFLEWARSKYIFGYDENYRTVAIDRPSDSVRVEITANKTNNELVGFSINILHPNGKFGKVVNIPNTVTMGHCQTIETAKELEDIVSKMVSLFVPAEEGS
jgi:hypothetical protein